MTTKVEFIESHQPGLGAGEYKVEVTQTIESTNSRYPIKSNNSFTLNKYFQVKGERFHLKPVHVGSVFPPNHNLGKYSNVLPHITLTRSTLPWERYVTPLLDESTNTPPSNTPAAEANGEIKKIPWLALLVFYQDEIAALPTSANENTVDATKVNSSTVTLADLESKSSVSPYFPGLSLDVGQQPTDKVKVIDVPKSILKKTIPTAKELKLLTHVRQKKENDIPTGKEIAVIMAKRLPEQGKTTTVHLVSLEDRFTGGQFDDNGAGDTDQIRLISLKSWQFTCLEHFKVTQEFLDHPIVHSTFGGIPVDVLRKLYFLEGQDFYSRADFLTALTETARLTSEELTANQAKILHDFAFGDFASILRHINQNPSTLRLPGKTTDFHLLSDEKYGKYLQQSFIPSPHYFRNGDVTVSWFHGPLVANDSMSSQISLTLPAKASDQLLQYYEEYGMLDASYAAAWELGRLLALQDQSFSKALYSWKRNHIHELRKAEQILQESSQHFPGSHPSHLDTLGFPDKITHFFDDLHLLKGIPFNYLVPNETMLPVESIRFFTVDKSWIEALVDGAFSIGRVIEKDHENDQTLVSGLKEILRLTGFLLRSEVVSGWPDLKVDGYSGITNNPEEVPTGSLSCVRMEKLSENVLICLFHGTLQTIDIHLKLKALQFGFSVEDSGNYGRKLREANGDETGKQINLNTHDPVLINTTTREIDIFELAQTVGGTNSADFALQMVEGVEKVRFMGVGSVADGV